MTLALGHRSVAECQKWISSPEFTEWQVFNERNPIGQEREDWLFAMLAAVLANVWRGKNQRAAKVTDFLPKWGEERKPVDLAAKLKAMEPFIRNVWNPQMAKRGK